MKIIAVDLGGTKIEVMLTEQDVLQVIDKKRVATQRDKGYQFILDQIVTLIKQYQLHCKGEQTAIGLCIPGSVDQDTSLIKNSCTLCLNDKNLKKDIEAHVHQPVAIINDANAFVLSEATLGAAQSHNNVFGVIMGTGVGGGWMCNNQLINGLHGNTGEWGHSSIDIKGEPCWCGQKGCIEQYLSGPAIERRYHRKSKKHLDLKQIYQHFIQEDDHHAVKTIEETALLFGRAMANVINILDPDVIVLGGGVSNLDILYSQGIQQTKAHAFNHQLQTKILKNQLGDSSGIYGAALIATGPL